MTLITRTDNGSPDNRVDIIIMGDGYLASESDTFETHADSLTDYLFQSGGQLSDPFGRYQNFFNVHLIYTLSNESGTDDPSNGQFKDTAMDSSFLFDGVTDRLLSVSTAKANAILNAELEGTGIDPEMRFVTVNTDKYGGAGGYYATYAGGNSSATELALHEVGHSFAGLADEYWYSTGTYTGAEPEQPNITTDPDAAKWDHWIGYDQPGIGVIGAYEGGGYNATGLYRPSENSKMRALGEPFDAIAIETFILKFYQLVDPLDSWSNADFAHVETGADFTPTLLTGVKTLSVTSIDDAVIDVEWSLNGTLLGNGDVSQLDLRTLGLAPGTVADISARAYDPTDLVRIHLDELEMTISWSAKIPYYVSSTKGTGGADILKGVGWADKIVAKAGNDKLYGYAGKDKLLGGNGQDILLGGKGKDILTGGHGKDTLTGGAKDDQLTGGKGADTFVFNSTKNTGQDTISDFQDGQDKIKITGGLSFDDLTITQNDFDTLIQWEKGAALLQNTLASDITIDDFNFA